jgi:hypothetical protein
MKTKTLASLAGLGVALGIAACSFVSCSEPPTECQVGLNSPYVLTFTPVGAMPACAAGQPSLLQPGDTFGMEFYNPPAPGSTIVDGGLSIGTYSTTVVTMAAVSDTMVNLQTEYSDQMYPDGIIPGAPPGTPPDPVFFTDGLPGDEPYAAGQFQSQFPDGNDFCYVPTLQPAQEVFSYMDGGTLTAAGTPMYPEPTTFGESWSNLKVYVTAAVQGDQLTGTLSRTINSCTVNYTVVGMWPAVPCTSQDPNTGAPVPAIGMCSPCADPDAGMAVGSGINPNFPVACNALYNVNDSFGRGGACENLQTDPLNCGACGAVCPALEICQAGACVAATGATLCLSPPPATGSATCSSTSTSGCVATNVSNDPNNCGTCGTVCGASQVCSAGTCTSACGAGLTTCANMAAMTTACADVQTDGLNCGACGNVCANGNCTAGACTCTAGETLCAGVCTNVSNDPNNCGTCGTPCAAGQTCSGGTCSFAPACPTGLTQCGGAPYYCVLTGQGTATGNSTLPQLNSGEPACANASNEN